MNKKIIGLILTGFLSVSSAQAETYENETFIRVLSKPIATIEEIAKIKINGIDSAEEFNILGDFYVYNDKYRNTKEAYLFYETAAVRGSEYAKLMIGYMTYKGYGIDKNKYKGIRMLKNIKEPYSLNAQYLLGKFELEEGSTEKAIEIFKKVKDPKSYELLTKALIERKRYEESIPYLQWLIAEEKSTYAKRELGLIYLTPEYNEEKNGIKLLTMAAKEGDTTAQYQLGLYYHKGTNKTKANIKEAVRWYKIASQNDNSFARQELLKILNFNNAHNNYYGLENDPYLVKLIQREYAKDHY